MKKIEALIRPFELDEVRDNLHKIGIQDIVVSDVRSSSGNKDDDSYLGENYAGYTIEFMPKVKIEIVVEDANLRKASEALLKTSHNPESKSSILIYDIQIGKL